MNCFFVFFTIRGIFGLFLPSLAALTCSRFQERWFASFCSLFVRLWRSTSTESCYCCWISPAKSSEAVSPCKAMWLSFSIFLCLDDILAALSIEISAWMFWNFFDVENRPFEPSERKGDRYSDIIQLKSLTSESSSILCLFNECNSALFHSA